MHFIKLLLSFSPWLAFMVLSGPDLHKTKTAIIVASVLLVITAITKLSRGTLLKASAIFFACAIVMVVFLENAWVARHLSILSYSTLALTCWVGIALKTPFTLELAKQQVDPSLWNHPEFLKTNVIITSVWGGYFTVLCILSLLMFNGVPITREMLEIVKNILMLGVALFTIKYPQHVRKKRARSAPQPAEGV